VKELCLHLKDWMMKIHVKIHVQILFLKNIPFPRLYKLSRNAIHFVSIFLKLYVDVIHVIRVLYVCQDGVTDNKLSSVVLIHHVVILVLHVCQDGVTNNSSSVVHYLLPLVRCWSSYIIC